MSQRPHNSSKLQQNTNASATKINSESTFAISTMPKTHSRQNPPMTTSKIQQNSQASFSFDIYFFALIKRSLGCEEKGSKHKIPTAYQDTAVRRDALSAGSDNVDIRRLGGDLIGVYRNRRRPVIRRRHGKVEWVLSVVFEFCESAVQVSSSLASWLSFESSLPL